MYWLDIYRLAEIHRETYVALLKAWVPHGHREEFASRCGITREYFSCLCALDDQTRGDIPIHKRYPSPQLAKRIAKLLQAPTEIKRNLLENMELSHHRNAQIHYTHRQKTEPPRLVVQLSDLKLAHQKATFENSLIEVRRAYRIVRDASENLLRYTDPKKYPDSFAQLCLYHHDVQCVLNRPDKALFFAKLAQVVLESNERIEMGYANEDRDNLEINAIRGEAVAYQNLKLDRLVPDILISRASRTRAYKNSQFFWEPFVKRDLINATIEIPRFSIREVTKTALEMAALCEKTGDQTALFLVNESWLRSLIKCEKIKQAQRILYKQIEELPNLYQVGTLHRALLFKSGAELAWKMQDIKTWEQYITEALILMYRAGLKHQLVQVSQVYGAAVNPILRKISHNTKSVRSCYHG